MNTTTTTITGRSGRVYSDNEMLSCKELADAIGHCESYIYAMRQQGFKLCGGRQTPNQARAFLDARPSFTSTQYYRPNGRV